jgi:hypothetical protein
LRVAKSFRDMTDYIQAWQCIGCGKIEAPQPCIGVCRDRKIFMVGKDDYEHARNEIEALRAQLATAHAMLQRFGLAKPNKNQWQRSWLALQAQVREALAVLDKGRSAEN